MRRRAMGIASAVAIAPLAIGAVACDMGEIPGDGFDDPGIDYSGVDDLDAGDSGG